MADDNHIEAHSYIGPTLGAIALTFVLLGLIHWEDLVKSFD